MPAKVKIFHKSGDSIEVFSVDASDAITRHPDEWSRAPFPKAEAESKAKTESAAEIDAKHKAEAESKK